ncbi:MAG: helix-turn-helix transcriptional regulator [Spirochaetota bacterium]
MTQIGDKLRRAREEKGFDFERVAEETRIAKHYLAALEEEDFSVFPGDPYAIGFLRNYAEFLGLDSNELAASFRTIRIQEQPVPIQQLIPARRTNPLVFVVVALALVVAALAAFLMFGRGKGDPGASLSAPHVPTEYRMDAPSIEKRLWAGDSMLVSVGSETWKVVLAVLGDGAIFDTPMGQRRLSLGEETAIDFDKNGQPDLRILLTDLDKKNSSRGANLRFSLIGASPQVAPTAPATASAAGSPQAATATAEGSAGQGPSQTVPREGAIFEGQKSSYPFVVSVSFRAPCMFRYEVDKRDRDERYYAKGDTVSINANNMVRLWASNAQAAVVLVQASGGKTSAIDLGDPGEVAVKRIAWTQNDNGSYTLSLFDVD